jgi:hypothetical protein
LHRLHSNTNECIVVFSLILVLHVICLLSVPLSQSLWCQ